MRYLPDPHQRIAAHALRLEDASEQPADEVPVLEIDLVIVADLPLPILQQQALHQPHLLQPSADSWSHLNRHNYLINIKCDIKSSHPLFCAFFRFTHRAAFRWHQVLLYMKERTNSLLFNSAEIEAKARELSKKIDSSLAKAVANTQHLDSLSKCCENFDKSIASLKEPFQGIEKEIKQLDSSSVLLEQKDKRIRYFQQLLAKKEQQKEALQLVNQDQKKTIEEQRKSIAKLEQESIIKKQVKLRLKILMQQLHQLKSVQNNIKEQVSSNFSNLNRNLIQTVQGIEKTMPKKGKTEISAPSFIAEKDNQILKLKQKYKKLQKQFFDTFYSISVATDNRPPAENSDFSELDQNLVTSVINSIYALSFLGQSKIAKQQSSKIWLMEKLKQFTKNDLKIKSTLLYQYDVVNPKPNFHAYIDDKPNILAIAQLQNGNIIGGYSVYTFSKQTNKSDGFLFNLLQQSWFCSKYESLFPVAKYDEYYFIFGNSEFRIKSGQLKLFSNFGISNSTFDSGSTSLKHFMGQTDVERQYVLQKFEIHQIWP